MQKTIYSLLVIFTLALTSFAQNDKSKDREAIKQMCGCYEVKFNFAETFQYSSDSTYKPSKTKHDYGLEWVQLLDDKDDKIVLQHLLIVGSKDKPFVIKHWRQDWLYENTEFYMFDHDERWKYVTVPKSAVKGQWTQKVYQVDDSPRYEGSASWIHADGKTYWENTTDAPLPRREYTTRSDYNVTVRNNRHEIVKEGWIHDQDNKKVVRKDGRPDIVLAEEKGYNTYTRVDDSRCKAAQEWWAANHSVWDKVRREWDIAFARNKNLQLKNYERDSSLFEKLTTLSTGASQKDIHNIMSDFIEK